MNMIYEDINEYDIWRLIVENALDSREPILDFKRFAFWDSAFWILSFDGE